MSRTPHIRAAIARRYAVLEDQGFEVESGGGQNIFSLFDYLHGLSQVLQEARHLLFSASEAQKNGLSGGSLWPH